MNFAGLCRFSRVCAVLCLSLGVSRAGNFSFTGVFTGDDQRELFTFTAPSASVQLLTLGYGGGTNSLLNTIPSGGFDPILSLFDSTGGLQASSPLVFSDDNGTCPPLTADPATGFCWDSYMSLTSLSAGDEYTLVLTEADNAANGPFYGNGFVEDGNGNFTASQGCGGPAFCLDPVTQRTGAWAVDILGVGKAADTTGGQGVPEPTPALLLTTGCTGLLLLRRRRKNQQS